MPCGPRCLRCRVDILSGPRAFDGFDFLIAAFVCSGVKVVAFSRLFFFRILVVVLADFELLWFVTELNCLLKAFDMLLGFDKYLPLKRMA